MAGLVPAIHVLPAAQKTWMRGTSPRMTVERLSANGKGRSSERPFSFPWARSAYQYV
jgi:hypothetical protein